MLGLEKNQCCLVPHEKAWETYAQTLIRKMKTDMGDVFMEVHHIGSTAVPGLKAKPVIDLIAKVPSTDILIFHEDRLRVLGFDRVPPMSPHHFFYEYWDYPDGHKRRLMCVLRCVAPTDPEWKQYPRLCDFLKKNQEYRQKYEETKLSLIQTHPSPDAYRKGKKDILRYLNRKATVYDYLGRLVDIEMDRPIGTPHPKHPDILYPVNYGYIPGVLGGDGEELDVYLLGLSEPCNHARARVIGIAHRENDNEDKLIAAPRGVFFTEKEMEEAIRFQEQFYLSHVEGIPEDQWFLYE